MKSINTKTIVRLFGWWAPALALTLASPNAWAVNYNLTVSHTGSGRTSPSGTSSRRGGYNVGVSAFPTAGNVFVNWTDDNNGNAVLSSSSYYRYPMPNAAAAITAHFIPNLFPAARGLYNGLFIDSSDIIAHETAGFITLSVGPSTTKPSVFTGRLYIDGDIVPFSGQFSLSGDWTSGTLPRTATGKPGLTVHLVMDLTGATDYDITGTVMGGALAGSLVQADRTTPVTTPVTTSLYVVKLPGADLADAASKPSGYGCMRVRIARGGTGGQPNNTFNAGVRLADNALALAMCATRVSHGRVPLYIRAYLSGQSWRGSVIGWVGVDQTPAGAGRPLSGTLVWTRTAFADPSFPLYPAGFTNDNIVIESSALPAGPVTVTDIINYQLRTATTVGGTPQEIIYPYWNTTPPCFWGINNWGDLCLVTIHQDPQPDAHSIIRHARVGVCPTGGRCNAERYIYDINDPNYVTNPLGGLNDPTCHAVTVSSDPGDPWIKPAFTRPLTFGVYLPNVSTGYGYFIEGAYSYPYTFEHE